MPSVNRHLPALAQGLLACLAMMLTPPIHAEAGKWTPDQILDLDPVWLKKIGLELPPSDLWKEGGGGLLEAAVQISGCTAGFVSADGLLATNHHCAFSILQQHSTPERDLITHGFLAASREQELPAATVRATIPVSFTDVTAEIEAAAAAAKDDYERYQAIDRAKKEMVARCETSPAKRCQVATFDDGVAYRLIEAQEFPDVRLVYAPPLGVGEYGGEIDNWSWPRHTGDFALLRIYAEGGAYPAPHAASNTPYRPRRFFPLATAGPTEGDFVMVLGYPGLTFRSLIAAEMEERAHVVFARRAELYRRWIDLMEEAGKGNSAVEIALADRIKSLANREKNSRGQLAGIARGKLIERKRQADREVLTWAESRPEQRPAVAAYQGLEALVRAGEATSERDFLLRELRAGAKPLALAVTVTRWALEREKPDLERDADYQERNRSRAREELEREQKRIDPATEEKLAIDWLARMAALPKGSRSAALDAFQGPAREAAAIAARVAELFAATKVTDLEERRRMFDQSVAELRARRDPLLDLAFRLNEEILAIERRDKENKGAISRHRPSWRRAMAAHAGRPIDPDANGTLRVSLAHVAGYTPRDGMWMKPFTTLSGVVEKHTGESPFAAPQSVLGAAGAARTSRWASAALKDVPVCFLATGDTTGGNSGSPVVNGKGELVGINFDRVWENVANDFGYNPEVARNIAVDTRYLLWMLETLGGEAAGPLLAELGIAAQP